MQWCNAAINFNLETTFKAHFMPTERWIIQNSYWLSFYSQTSALLAEAKEKHISMHNGNIFHITKCFTRIIYTHIHIRLCSIIKLCVGTKDQITRHKTIKETF
jgi:hypothetical protein